MIQEKRSCSINNGRIRKNEIISYKHENVQENSPETTRYRPTQSTPRSPEDESLSPYNLNEIELPAYWKDHPDSKLLYIVQKTDDEILCCVYCALEQKQKDPHCNVIEIRDYLKDLVKKSQEVLAQPSNSIPDTSSISAQIISENDKEISMIKQYYNKVIEALTQERDEKINEIGQLTNKNVEMVSNLEQKVDTEKVKNFGSEISKLYSF